MSNSLQYQPETKYKIWREKEIHEKRDSSSFITLRFLSYGVLIFHIPISFDGLYILSAYVTNFGFDCLFPIRMLSLAVVPITIKTTIDMENFAFITEGENISDKIQSSFKH